MTMGDSVVLSPAAQAGMRALMAWMGALEKERGITRSTWEGEGGISFWCPGGS
jgi:hypothetical protein